MLGRVTRCAVFLCFEKKRVVFCLVYVWIIFYEIIYLFLNTQIRKSYLVFHMYHESHDRPYI